MKWYAAHVIMYFKIADGKQRSVPAWENIVLIRARNAEEAYAKAEQRGRDELLGDDGSILWGGIPAKMMFAGIRKLTLCQDDEKRPTDGTEISYIEMEFGSEKAIYELVAGEAVSLKITDSFPNAEAIADEDVARHPVKVCN